MHSSLVMPLGRSDAGLECPSDYRASMVQRMHRFLRAQHVVSTIIYWSCGVGDDFDLRQGEFFAEQALRPAHERQSHTEPSRAAVVLPLPREFSPSCLW
jgi:hypothetical protein